MGLERYWLGYIKIYIMGRDTISEKGQKRGIWRLFDREKIDSMKKKNAFLKKI